ncbi:MAG: hypothetical protein JWP44_4519 [Mucilaginibacter sp.]|nr:hypothetical protein [Mucilaginibacter sp.]
MATNIPSALQEMQEESRRQRRADERDAIEQTYEALKYTGIPNCPTWTAWALLTVARQGLAWTDCEIDRVAWQARVREHEAEARRLYKEYIGD